MRCSVWIFTVLDSWPNMVPEGVEVRVSGEMLFAPLVFAELQIFLDAKVPQVKFVDRTFNCNHERTLALLHFLRMHDNGVTNFHFEVAADLLNEAELAEIAAMREGLVQLEIGVQSTNLQTIEAIDRTMNLEKLKKVVASVHRSGSTWEWTEAPCGDICRCPGKWRK